MDLWILTYFKVLPTDPKFLDLSEHQKQLLFQGYLSLPESEQVKQAYWKSKVDSEVFPRKVQEDLKKVGYTDEKLKWIQEQLEQARE